MGSATNTRLQLSVYVLLLLVLVGHLQTKTLAWVPQTINRRTVRHAAATVLLSAVEAATEGTNNNNENRRGETLRFAGDLTFDSVPLEASSLASKQDMNSYLQGNECRRLLLGAGGTRSVESLPPSSGLRAMWTNQLASGFAQGLPETPDEFLRTDTTVNFPGLTLTNTVVNGFSIVESGTADETRLSSEGSLSSTTGTECACASLLIGESRSTSGRKPLVWIFNKLTGDGGAKREKEDPYSDPKARVVTHTSVAEHNDDGMARSFRIHVRFEVLINFPGRLLRILPTSKETMESRGSAAIERALSKDFSKAVEGVRDGFLESQRHSLKKLKP